MRLRIVILDSRACAPPRGAAVDLWHYDAMGLYSGYMNLMLGGPNSPTPQPETSAESGPLKPTDKYTFLRGIQFTGADGAVEFQLAFPGYYEGCTNHVHLKVRLDGHRQRNTYAGRPHLPHRINLLP